MSLTVAVLSIWFEFVAFETGTSVIAHTQMGTVPVSCKPHKHVNVPLLSVVDNNKENLH